MQDLFGKILASQIYANAIMEEIKSVLTPDLLKGTWRKPSDNPMKGHCYVATEAFYWILGGDKSNISTYVITHKVFPKELEAGGTHWFAKDNSTNEIYDITKSQFKGNIPYSKGRRNGMMKYPKGGSKRAREVIKRILDKKNLAFLPELLGINIIINKI